MASRLRRTSSKSETLLHVRRARQFAERYGIDEVNPVDYLPPAADQDFDDLLSRIK